MIHPDKVHNVFTPDAGIEPATTRLKVVRSSDWANWARDLYSHSYIHKYRQTILNQNFTQLIQLLYLLVSSLPLPIYKHTHLQCYNTFFIIELLLYMTEIMLKFSINIHYLYRNRHTHTLLATRSNTVTYDIFTATWSCLCQFWRMQTQEYFVKNWLYS